MPKTTEPRKPPAPERDWLVIGAALALLPPVLLPFLVSFLPELYLQFDPRRMPQAVTATEFGPAGVAWWQVYALLASSAALGVAARRGVRLSAWALGLGGMGMAACGWHVFGGTMTDRLQCGAWFAGIALGLAALHLGQLPMARRWCCAALIAVSIPVTLDAIYYVFVSHPMTVERFEAEREATLAARGWAPGSSEAKKFEERLRVSDATGAFGLSNVLGSFGAALALLAAGLVAGGRHKKNITITSFLLGLAALAGTTLWLTKSKGALAALFAGGVLLIGFLAAGKQQKLARWLPVCAVLLVMLAVGAVFARGALGPPDDVQGERSILFRYHYLRGAASMLLGESPRALTLGIGPSGFHDLYPKYKVPISPEMVASAHNAWADQIVMLGLGGAAASWLLLLMAWWGAAPAPNDPEEVDSDALPGMSRLDLLPACLLGAFIFGVVYVVKLPAFAPENGLLWLAGLLGFVFVTAWLARPGALLLSGMRIGACVAGVCLLVHGQIELTFYNLASTGPAWFMMGLCGAGRTRLHDRPRVRHFLPAVVLSLCAVVFAATNASLITRQQSHVARAERSLRVGDSLDTLEQLDRSAAYIPVDSKPLRWRVAIQMELATGLAERGSTGAARDRLLGLFVVLDDAQAEGMSPVAANRYRAWINQMIARITDDPNALSRAASALAEAVKASPYNAHLAAEAGDMAMRAGDSGSAMDFYRQALENHTLNYLDQAHQLSPEEHQRIQHAVTRFESGG